LRRPSLRTGRADLPQTALQSASCPIVRTDVAVWGVADSPPRRLPFGDICKQLPVQVWAFRLRCSSPIGQSSSDGMTPFPLVCFRFPATLRSTGVTPLLHYYDGSESCSALFPAIYPSRSPAFTCTLFLRHTITNHTGMHTLRIRDITQVLQGSRPADFAIC
jgi:hypothetical protein